MPSAEIAESLSKIPGWEISTENGIPRLSRSFPFKNFSDGLAFANRVGAEADDQGHHPAILVEWGRVTISWWTHTIGGLHSNDFIMAARTNRLFEGKA